jgi:hypothetical protein
MKLARFCSYPLLTLLVSGAIFVGCNAKSDSDSDTETTATSTGIAGVGVSKSGAVNALADAFPVSLALSAFPQSTSGAALTGTADQEVDDPNADKDLKEKVEENKSIVEGKADNCLNPNVFRPHRSLASVTCYEFDSDMNPSRFPAEGSQTRPDFGTTDGTDGNGEACMVSFVRGEIQGVVEIVDQALALVGGMICQAKKDGAATGMPTTAAPLDLKASLKNATKGHLTVDSANLAKLDDIDGKSVYRSDIKVTNERGHVLEVHLVHSPGDGDNGNGTLWFIRSGEKAPAGSPANDPNGPESKNDVMSITYSRSETGGVPNMRFESSRARIADTIDPVDAAGNINFAGIPKEAQNDTINAIKYVAFDGNTETNEGNLSYWMNPGGSYDESARGFLFNTTVNTDSGVVAGCGISGATAAVSIRKSVLDPSDANTLQPVRYWHPQENKNIHPDKDARYSANEGDFITEQCFKQGSDGLYAIDADETPDAHGYDVIATAATHVEPPHRPEAKLEGQFVPETK